MIISQDALPIQRTSVLQLRGVDDYISIPEYNLVNDCSITFKLLNYVRPTSTPMALLGMDYNDGDRLTVVSTGSFLYCFLDGVELIKEPALPDGNYSFKLSFLNNFITISIPELSLVLTSIEIPVQGMRINAFGRNNTGAYSPYCFEEIFIYEAGVPVRYYPVNERSGTVVYDKIGGHHGTVVNMLPADRVDVWLDNGTWSHSEYRNANYARVYTRLTGGTDLLSVPKYTMIDGSSVRFSVVVFSNPTGKVNTFICAESNASLLSYPNGVITFWVSGVELLNISSINTLGVPMDIELSLSGTTLTLTEHVSGLTDSATLSEVLRFDTLGGRTDRDDRNIDCIIYDIKMTESGALVHHYPVDEISGTEIRDIVRTDHGSTIKVPTYNRWYHSNDDFTIMDKPKLSSVSRKFVVCNGVDEYVSVPDFHLEDKFSIEVSGVIWENTHDNIINLISGTEGSAAAGWGVLWSDTKGPTIYINNTWLVTLPTIIGIGEPFRLQMHRDGNLLRLTNMLTGETGSSSAYVSDTVITVRTFSVSGILHRFIKSTVHDIVLANNNVPLHVYKMDEHTGNTLVDSVAGAHGTLVSTNDIVRYKGYANTLRKTLIDTELVINGDFSSSDSWSLNQGWSVVNGQAVGTDIIEASQTIQQYSVFDIGKEYRIYVSGYTESGKLCIIDKFSQPMVPTQLLTTNKGHVHFDWVADTTLLNFKRWLGSVSKCYIENVSAKEIRNIPFI